MAGRPSNPGGRATRTNLRGEQWGTGLDPLSRYEVGYLSRTQELAIDDELTKDGWEVLHHLREYQDTDKLHLWLCGKMVKKAQADLSQVGCIRPSRRNEAYEAARFFTEKGRGGAFMSWLGFTASERSLWRNLSKFVLQQEALDV